MSGLDEPRLDGDLTAMTTRRAVLARYTAVPLSLALTACGTQTGGTPPPPSSAAGGTPPAGVLVQPVLPNTDTAVGRNRFAVAVLRVGQGGALPAPITDAGLKLRFFHPIEPQATLKSEATPEFRFVGDKTKGLYVAHVEFDRAGTWGVEISGTAGGQTLRPAAVRFEVKAKSETPAIGSPAPNSRNPTRTEVDDIKKIASEATACDMHELSIARALDEKKPVVILFSTPGFCTTQTCAPQLGEVQQLKTKYGNQASFVHVEIYKDPQTRTPWETVNEWKLTSEPWTFLIDRGGNVAEKFEGPAPVSELELSLQKLL